MASTYTPTATWVSTYQRPDDGDKITAASVNTGLEALGDRTEFLNNSGVIAINHYTQSDHPEISFGAAPQTMGDEYNVAGVEDGDTISINFNVDVKVVCTSVVEPEFYVSANALGGGSSINAPIALIQHNGPAATTQYYRVGYCAQFAIANAGNGTVELKVYAKLDTASGTLKWQDTFQMQVFHWRNRA